MKRVNYLMAFLLVAVLASAPLAQGTETRGNERKEAVAEEPGMDLHLGRYELYSGIPSIYIGHFILLANGKYKVAFDTDETNYDESGKYIYHKDTNTIEWVSGMFRNNNWGGKLTKTAKGYHIQFNKATFGDGK